MEGLKPCPFCGGSAIFNQTSSCSSSGLIGFDFKIRCGKCGSTTSGTIGKIIIRLSEINGELVITTDGRSKAIEAWNKRVDTNA